MMQNSSYMSENRPNRPQRLVEHLSRRWMLWFSLLYGLFVGLPLLAPFLMYLGAEIPARVIYTVYSFLCHQLPERSYFLFGPKVSYSLPEIQVAWQLTSDPLILRQFIGSPAMGWKVAWSDRMVSMYSAILLFAWLWWPLRNRVRPLHWIGLVLLALPMAADGTTHFVSDLMDMYSGFRYTNDWLVVLTGHAFPAAFYAGDAWGSFNAWMRLITGGLFSLGVVWFGFPYLDQVFKVQARLQEKNFDEKSHLPYHGNRCKYIYFRSARYFRYFPSNKGTFAGLFRLLIKLRRVVAKGEMTMAKIFLFLLLLALTVTGCAVQPAAPGSTPTETGENVPLTAPSITPSSSEAEEGGYSALVDGLTSAGAAVEPAGKVEQPFFSVPGQVVRVNGQDVQVFEFDNEEARQAQSNQISIDGSTIGPNMVTWIDKPHFWAKGKTIVLYIGQDQETINLINQVMGIAITQP